MDRPYWWENGSIGSSTSPAWWPIWAALRSRFFRNRAPVLTTPLGTPVEPDDHMISPSGRARQTSRSSGPVRSGTGSAAALASSS